jgi:hypothetical protein
LSYAWEIPLKLLDAVNLVLPKLGEHPVTSLDVRHPTVGIILPEVGNELKTLLIRGWWFNEFVYTAYPDTNGEIIFGEDTLSFVPASTEPLAALRGVRLYKVDTLSYTWDKPIKGILTQMVDFEELPEAAAQYVWYSALLNAMTTDLGVSEELNVWGSKAQAAWTSLLAEHLRQRRYSTKNSKRFQKLRSAMRG